MTESDESTPKVESAEPAQPMADDEDRLWAALAHLGGVVGFLPSLIIFLVLRHRGPKTAVESKEALNWQITFTICWLVAEFLATIIAGILVVAVASSGGDAGTAATVIRIVVPVAVWVVNIVLSAIGFTTVSRGGSYRYPFALRFIR